MKQIVTCRVFIDDLTSAATSSSTSSLRARSLLSSSFSSSPLLSSSLILWSSASFSLRFPSPSAIYKVKKTVINKNGFSQYFDRQYTVLAHARTRIYQTSQMPVKKQTKKTTHIFEFDRCQSVDCFLY